MGRHSASYIEAQQRVSGPTVLSAASHVGRVGALALALGIGAAVASGAGIAHAEGPTDNDATGSAAQSSPHPSTSEGTPSTSESTAEAPASTGSHDARTGRPESPNVPKMQLGNGRGAPKVDQPHATDRPGSLPELIASIPQRLATALLPHAPGGASESTTPTLPATPRIRSHAGDTVTAGPRHADPAETGRPADDEADEAPVSSRVANAAAVVRADVQHLVSTPSTTTAVPVSSANSVASEPITPIETRPAPTNPIAMAVANVLSALGIQPAVSSTGDTPVGPPIPTLHAALQLIHREIERFTLSLGYTWPTAWSPPIPTNAVPSIAPPGVPAPADDAPTVYGDIGKWMLQANGQISNYGGLPYGGRTLLEPVNVIIVDPTSSSAAESACKLNAAMFWSGFPAQPIHSTGFLGTIDDVIYGQQPTGLLLGFSDNFFLFPNNHGRIFGPDPVETSTGYVWSGAFSTEQLVIYDFLPRHAYVSSNLARNALAMRLVASGQATYGGMVPLNNAYNTATTTTGDHDGYAVVIVLR